MALGSFFPLGEQVCEALKENGICATLVNPLFISDLDCDALEAIKEKHSLVITLEDGILDGGFGSKIARYYGNTAVRVINYGFKKEFPYKYTLEGIMAENRLTVPQIVEDILNSK